MRRDRRRQRQRRRQSPGCSLHLCCRSHRAAARKAHRGRLEQSPHQAAHRRPRAVGWCARRTEPCSTVRSRAAGLTRGVSEGMLLLDENPWVRGLALTRIRDAEARTVRIPVDWRDFVVSTPPADFRSTRPGEPRVPVRAARCLREERRGGGPRTAARGLPRAGLRRSAAPLALRLPRQLGAEPDGARRVRRRAGPSLRRLLPRSSDARCARCRA